jgi:hypothetical protein
MIDYSKFKLTKEEKELLKRNASHLNSAYNSEYTLPVLHGQLVQLNNMVNKYYNKDFKLSCPKCVLNLLKALYPLAKANNLL